ncbi:hypothetical protein ACFQ3S_10785 [Mucilaginibacter terrae]|uniref:hypothetical protein n=1 Tax=Mucilaginibacter terrae TaxID=1955052 RepID=UPI0036414927
MKTLLIPTDFNIKSLNCIPALRKRYYPEKVNIVLVHMMKITDNMQELLMLSRRSTEYQHISEEFYNTCARLRQNNKNSIHNIRIEFFYGSTVAVFKNFLEANEVDAIVLLNNYRYALLNKNSIDPAQLVTRSGSYLLYVDCNEQHENENVAITDEALIEERV